MQISTLPSISVNPSLRNEIENVLHPDETLSEFIKTAVKSEIIRRQNRQEFIAKGLASRDSAIETKVYYDAADVLDELDKMYELKTNK